MSETATTTWPAPGLYPGIDPAVYFRDGFKPTHPLDSIVSKSLLSRFAANPARFRWQPEMKSTPAMTWGSLVDCCLMTPERIGADYVWTPDTYPGKDGPKPWNRNAKYCKDWEAKHAGITVVKLDELCAAKAAAKIVAEDRRVAPILKGAAFQVGMRSDITLDGQVIRCKGLIDIAPDRDGEWGNALVDFKTTGTLDSARDLVQTIARFSYHLQAAFYLDLWNHLTGEGRDTWVLVFQLSSEPYEVAVVELDRAAILEGRRRYLEILRQWVECATKDEWPSPFENILQLDLPAWAYGKEEA